jgi:hypothetical protein
MPLCVRKENFAKLQNFYNHKYGTVTLPIIVFLNIIKDIMHKLNKWKLFGKVNFQDVIKLLNMIDINKIKPVKNTHEVIIKFYYRLLSCMVENYTVLFGDNVKYYNILLDYCITIEIVFERINGINDFKMNHKKERIMLFRHKSTQNRNSTHTTLLDRIKEYKLSYKNISNTASVTTENMTNNNNSSVTTDSMTGNSNLSGYGNAKEGPRNNNLLFFNAPEY